MWVSGLFGVGCLALAGFVVGGCGYVACGLVVLLVGVCLRIVFVWGRSTGFGVLQLLVLDCVCLLGCLWLWVGFVGCVGVCFGFRCVCGLVIVVCGFRW